MAIGYHRFACVGPRQDGATENGDGIPTMPCFSFRAPVLRLGVGTSRGPTHTGREAKVSNMTGLHNGVDIQASPMNIGQSGAPRHAGIKPGAEQ